jgi:hypothetical protein
MQEVITNAQTGEVTIRDLTPEEIAALQTPPTHEEQEVARRVAYMNEADPLFFKAQRNEATMEEWQAKVAEIKARYPYPEE